jgi:hypothetical protein
MLEALCEAALLRYVAIVHWSRGVQEVDPRWKDCVTGVVVAHRPLLAGYWSAARSQPESERLVAALERELDTIARTVLKHIKP